MASKPYLSTGALLSPCQRYRLTLHRRWSDGRTLQIVMLNPSTADANADDPTIRKCVGFAALADYGAIEVLNLFAFRATNPRELLSATDPVGPQNRDLVLAAARGGGCLFAWGANLPPSYLKWATEVGDAGNGNFCLGTTKAGHPRHPLMLSYKQPLLWWGGYRKAERLNKAEAGRDK